MPTLDAWWMDVRPPRWLMPLNFVVLQWFGIRLGRVYGTKIANGRIISAWLTGDGISIGHELKIGERVLVGWTLLRWIWPLTGWWSDYRWIGRRQS